MDALGHIIDTLQMKGVFFFRTDFSSPFGIRAPSYEHATRFHLMVQGRCFVTLKSGAAVEINAGDIILIPAGLEHTLSSDPCAPTAPLEQVMEKAGYNGAGVFALGDGDNAASVQMICGHFTFRSGPDHPVLRALPEFIHIAREERAKYAWLDEILQLIVKRVFSDPESSATTITRLSEVLFIEALRAGADQSPALARIINALKARPISEALCLMHERLNEQWTLEKLAEQVGMSRSRFAEQFREAIGCAPMTYLTDWRIQKAISLLTASQLSVQQVAAKTGYQSPAAFTRAFSQKTGRSPKQYRRLETATVH